MAMTVADHVLERLTQWDVHRIYGFPGDGINGLLGAFERRTQDLQFVQVRHEEMAAFMACAHAKWTGDVGVCCATSGPGAIHLLNGLYDAKLDHQPVVAIVGQTYVRAMGGSFQQEVDLLNLYKDVAGAYVQQCDTPAAVRHMIDRAVRIARAERTVTAVIIPADLQEMEAEPDPPHATHTVHSGIGWREPVVVPQEVDLRAAADILNQGERVAMLVGAGALHATDEVLSVADTLGAGVAKALLGKAAVPDDPDRGCAGDAARPAAPAPPARGPQLAAEGHRVGRRLVEADGRAGAAAALQPGHAAAPGPVPHPVAAPARERDRQLRLGVGGELVRPPSAAAAGDEGVALGQPGDDAAGRALRDRS
jgi:thiamine pyrophosphate-dependent acetolactate synthase large subunit-like protein